MGSRRSRRWIAQARISGHRSRTWSVESRHRRNDGEILIRGPHITRVPLTALRRPLRPSTPKDGCTPAISDNWTLTACSGDRHEARSSSTRGARTRPRTPSRRPSSGESFLISHVVAIGDWRNYNTALIVLDPDALAKMGCQPWRFSVTPIWPDPRTRAEIRRAVSAGGERLS